VTNGAAIEVPAKIKHSKTLERRKIPWVWAQGGVRKAGLCKHHAVRAALQASRQTCCWDSMCPARTPVESTARLHTCLVGNPGISLLRYGTQNGHTRCKDVHTSAPAFSTHQHQHEATHDRQHDMTCDMQECLLVYGKMWRTLNNGLSCLADISGCRCTCASSWTQSAPAARPSQPIAADYVQVAPAPTNWHTPNGRACRQWLQR
jgi:uncharacterized protein YcfJ